MESNSIQIKFDGSEHQIDANTLINVLTHYNNIINVVNREYGGGAKEIRLQVNAFERGSFIIDLSLSGILGLFSATSLGYLADVVTVATGVFAAYKLMKGKPAKTDGEKESVKFCDKVTINDCIVNVYNIPAVRQAISKAVETANGDSSVDSVSFITKEHEEVTYERGEFISLIYDDFDREDDIPQERHIDTDATLVIRSLSFEKGYLWQFYYNGIGIRMTVKDDALMAVIDKGERFGKGDSIRVKLRIIQRWDNPCRVYVNSAYKILEYYGHTESPQQRKIDFGQPETP